MSFDDPEKCKHGRQFCLKCHNKSEDRLTNLIQAAEDYIKVVKDTHTTMWQVCVKENALQAAIKAAK